VEIRPPKYRSERTVYAPDGLMAMLSEHIRAYGRDDLLFPGGWRPQSGVNGRSEVLASMGDVTRWR